MPTPSQLIPAVANANIASADVNNNWVLLEETAQDLGPMIVTGLVPSAGSGLSVNVTAGTAVIGMRVTTGASSIGGLAPSTTNHLYLLANGTFTSNTTGTAPANSVKLGTATTGVATVTAVDTTRGTAGRQNKLSFPGQPAGTEIRLALINVGILDSGGVNSLNLNGGTLTAGAANFGGIVGGSNTAFSWKRFSLTFPSDADYTLGTGEKDAVLIDVQAGVITATRNIIVPGTLGGFYWVINRNAQSVVLKTSGGTGITVNSARARAICFPSGVNAFALTPNQDYTT